MRQRRQICAGLKPLSALIKGLNGVSQAALWLAVLLSPFVALAGGLGFQVTLFLLGLSAIIAWSVDRIGADYLWAAWPLFLLAFAGWAWISSLWSDYQSPNDYLLFGLLIPLLFVPLVFLRLSPLAKERLSLGVIGVGLLGVGLLVLESVSGFMLSFWADPVAVGGDPELRRGNAEMNIGRGQVSYAQLLWPFAGLLLLKLKRGWILIALSFIGLAVSAQLNNLNVIVPTLVVSVAAALVAWRNPKLGLMIAFFIAIVSILFAPLLAVLCGLVDVDFMRKIPLSWEHRVRMWSFSGELIKHEPWIGHGFDASRLFDERTFRAPDGRDITVMSLHPHNIGLQIWLETGLVGALLAVGFLLTLMKTVLKSCTEPVRAFAAAGLVVAVATSGAVTIGVWQHWWWALIVFSASLIILIPPKMNTS